MILKLVDLLHYLYYFQKYFVSFIFIALVYCFNIYFINYSEHYYSLNLQYYFLQWVWATHGSFHNLHLPLCSLGHILVSTCSAGNSLNSDYMQEKYFVPALSLQPQNKQYFSQLFLCYLWRVLTLTIVSVCSSKKSLLIFKIRFGVLERYHSSGTFALYAANL